MNPNPSQLGRNDPCHCGSGRKYKRCCRARDLAAEAADSRQARRAAAAGAGDWSVEALPVPIRVEERGSERPVAILITAGDHAVHQRLVGRLAGGPEAVASALDREIAAAAASVGVLPVRVLVRHADVRDALEPLLAPRDIDVEVDTEMPELRAFALGLLDHLGGCPHWPPVGRAEQWKAWDLPSRLSADLFEAAADFYEAAPWKVMENLQAPRCTMPSGRAWTAVVLGNGGEEFGLALHSLAADAFTRPGLDDPELGFAGVVGRIVSVTFERLSELPKKARAELAAARWRIAGPAAYPDLMTVNTPGGGVSAEDAEDLREVLLALPRFAALHGERLEREAATGVPCPPIDWTDAETGTAFRYAGEAMGPGFAFTSEEGIGGELRDEIQRVIDEVSGAAGPDLDADTFMARLNERLSSSMARVNAAPQEELGGLSPIQVQRLLMAGGTEAGGWTEEGGVLRISGDLTPDELVGVKVHEAISTLLELAGEQDGLGRTEAGNLKVAVVRELAERLGTRVPAWANLPQALGKRPREDHLGGAHHVRVLAELAGLLRPRRSRFDLTREGRALSGDRRAGERFALLFETCFRRFNLGYDTHREWPEGQTQFAFTLYRLGEVAREWRTPRELLESPVVLPFARERLATDARFDQGPSILRFHILERLELFGLLEERLDQGSSDRRYRVTPLYDRFLTFSRAGAGTQ